MTKEELELERLNRSGRAVTKLKTVYDLRKMKGIKYADTLKYLPKVPKPRFTREQQRIFVALLFGPHLRLRFTRGGTRATFSYELPVERMEDFKHIWRKFRRTFFREYKKLAENSYYFSTLFDRRLWIGLRSPTAPAYTFKFLRDGHYYKLDKKRGKLRNSLPDYVIYRNFPNFVVSYMLFDSGGFGYERVEGQVTTRYCRLIVQIPNKEMIKLLGLLAESDFNPKVVARSHVGYRKPQRGNFFDMRISLRHNNWYLSLGRHLPEHFSKRIAFWRNQLRPDQT